MIFAGAGDRHQRVSPDGVAHWRRCRAVALSARPPGFLLDPFSPAESRRGRLPVGWMVGTDEPLGIERSGEDPAIDFTAQCVDAREPSHYVTEGGVRRFGHTGPDLLNPLLEMLVDRRVGDAAQEPNAFRGEAVPLNAEQCTVGHHGHVAAAEMGLVGGAHASRKRGAMVVLSRILTMAGDDSACRRCLCRGLGRMVRAAPLGQAISMLLPAAFRLDTGPGRWLVAAAGARQASGLAPTSGVGIRIGGQGSRLSELAKCPYRRECFGRAVAGMDEATPQPGGGEACSAWLRSISTSWSTDTAASG